MYSSFFLSQPYFRVLLLPGSEILFQVSLFLVTFKSKNEDLKSLLVLPLFVVNFVTFIGEFFNFKEWLPEKRTSGMTQKIISVFVIPFVFIAIFFGVYSLGSDHFSNFFSTWEFFWITVLGFFWTLQFGISKSAISFLFIIISLKMIS